MLAKADIIIVGLHFPEPDLDRVEEGVLAVLFLAKGNEPTPLTTISQEVPMQKLIVMSVAVLCLVGAGSLAMADEAIKGELDAMKSDITAEKESMKADVKSKKEAMKAKKKAHKEEMKAKKHAMKEKAKAHKEELKAKGEEAKAAGQSMGQEMKAAGQDMKAAVPSIPAPTTAPAPAAGH